MPSIAIQRTALDQQIWSCQFSTQFWVWSQMTLSPPSYIYDNLCVMHSLVQLFSSSQSNPLFPVTEELRSTQIHNSYIAYMWRFIQQLRRCHAHHVTTRRGAAYALKSQAKNQYGMPNVAELRDCNSDSSSSSDDSIPARNCRTPAKNNGNDLW